MTLALVRRAEAAGFTAIALTVDATSFGIRRADARNKFSLPPQFKWDDQGYFPAFCWSSHEQNRCYLALQMWSFFKASGQTAGATLCNSHNSMISGNIYGLFKSNAKHTIGMLAEFASETKAAVIILTESHRSEEI